MRSLPRTFPSERGRGQTWSLFLTCLIDSGWMMPNNQNEFGENCLLSLYMGLNHPQKLFLMPDRCSKTIWENISFGWNFGIRRLWAWVVCLHLRKKYTTVIWKEKNDSSTILWKWIYSNGKCILFFILLF